MKLLQGFSKGLPTIFTRHRDFSIASATRSLLALSWDIIPPRKSVFFLPNSSKTVSLGFYLVIKIMVVDDYASQIGAFYFSSTYREIPLYDSTSSSGWPLEALRRSFCDGAIFFFFQYRTPFQGSLTWIFERFFSSVSLLEFHVAAHDQRLFTVYIRDLPKRPGHIKKTMVRPMLTCF